jgi:hypothetical protein
MAALAATTDAAYATGERFFVAFCLSTAVPPREMFPPSEALVLAFIAYSFFIRRASCASIKGYLCGVKSACRSLGVAVTGVTTTRVQLLMRSVKKHSLSKPRLPRLPITIWILARFRPLLDLRDHDSAMLWAAMCVAVYGLLRAGEFCAKAPTFAFLRRSQVTWFPDHICIHLFESKTDVFREGVDVRIFANGSATCPVAALREAFASAPDKAPTAPAFQDSCGRPLLYTTLLAAVRSLAVQLGYDAKTLGCHSLRIGGASTMAILGFPSYVIRAAGRWSSLTYQTYTRLDTNAFREISHRLATAAASKTAARSPFGVLSSSQASNVCFDNIDVVFNC